MADDELRLIGTFQDKISPGLKSSIEKIRAFTKEGERAGQDGERHTKTHAATASMFKESRWNPFAGSAIPKTESEPPDETGRRRRGAPDPPRISREARRPASGPLTALAGGPSRRADLSGDHRANMDSVMRSCHLGRRLRIGNARHHHRAPDRISRVRFIW
jgi:hypothetical protein